MNDLTLDNLYNPNNITAILTSNDGLIEAGEDQGFQEYPNKIELWGMIDGLLYRLKGWTTTLIATYGETDE